MESTHRHPSQGSIVRQIERVPLEVIEEFRQCYSAFILDHMGKLGCLHGIRALEASMIACGPAITVLGPDLDLRRAAIDLAAPGDVLVVASGTRDFACFGDGTAKRMQLKGLAGAVIDGLTRDAAGIMALSFPTFTAGVSPRNHHYPVAEQYGAVNVTIAIGGTSIAPGDLIFGDFDGVVVVPKEYAIAQAAAIAEAIRRERLMRTEMNFFEPFDVESKLRQRGYRFV